MDGAIGRAPRGGGVTRRGRNAAREGLSLRASSPLEFHREIGVVAILDWNGDQYERMIG